MPRVKIFIDGSNFYHGLKNNLGQANVDFFKFGKKLAGVGRLIGIAYYNSPRRQQDGAAEYRDQQRFFEYLRTVPGLTLHLGRLEPRTRTCPNCNYTHNILIEKDIDIIIAVDMLAGAFDNLYDTAVLVSGDGDFHRLISAVRKVGKTVHVAYFARGKARALADACDEFVLLDSAFMADCWR